MTIRRISLSLTLFTAHTSHCVSPGEIDEQIGHNVIHGVKWFLSSSSSTGDLTACLHQTTPWSPSLGYLVTNVHKGLMYGETVGQSVGEWG